MTLDGRRVIVTGATRGIGAAIARTLSAAGARVLLVARNGRTLEDMAASLPGSVACAADLLDAASAERVAREADEHLGGIDALVSNAGAFSMAPIERVTDADIDATLALNIAAPLRLIRAVVPVMRRAARGHLVTIGSVADRTAFPGNAIYAASKFGARAMHQVAREELRGSGIRASLIAPGPTDTPLWDPHDPDNTPGFTPRSRMLQPSDVADVVLWTLTRPDSVNIDELRLSHS